MNKMSLNSSKDQKNPYFVYERSSISMNGHFCPQQNFFGPPTHNWPTRPLPLPPPRMWTPIDYNYGNNYYRPCFAHSAHNMRTSHASNCCLLSPQHFACCANPYDSYGNNPSADSQPIITGESGDSLNGRRDESEVSEESDSTIDCGEELIEGCVSELEKKSNLDQLKAINETLKLSLGQTTEKLRETQLSVLKLSEKLALDYIEKYRNDLKKYGDYIRLECTRFYQNDLMATKLEPIVEQITEASNKAKAEKEKIRTKIAAQKVMLSEEINAKYDVFVFDYKSLPQFPDLLNLYKNIIDEIPVEFFDDMNFIKRSAKEFIKWKSSIDSNEVNGDNDLNYDSVKPDEQEFDIPVITEKPEMKSNESEVKELNISEEKFPAISLPNDSSIETSLPVIPLPSTSSDSTIDNTLRMNTNVNQTNEKWTFDITTDDYSLKFVIKTETNNESVNSMQNQAVFDSQLSNSSSVQSLKPNENLKSREISSTKVEMKPKEESKPKEKLKPIEEQKLKEELKPKEEQKPKEELKPKENSKPNEELKSKELLKGVEVPKMQKLNESQRKLLDKLKDKYKDLSDQVLIESMTKTKESMISSGNPKGFSGMKVTDIIMKISDYIDREVVPTQAIPKQIIPKGWGKVMEHTIGVKTYEKCSICSQDITNNDTQETRCRHSFHYSCISKWGKFDNTCPLCSERLV